MRQNRNELPEGKALPVEYKDKQPLHAVQAVIEEEAAEEAWKCLCKDGTYITVPASALVDVKKEGEGA